MRGRACRRASSAPGRRRATRANASGSPGSGGRHQQIGAPPPCGQTAVSTGPTTRRQPVTRPPRGRRPVPSGRQSKTRCGAVGSACATASLPSRLAAARRRRRRRRRASTAIDGVARERDPLDGGEALVVRRRLELAQRAHLRRRREQARLAATVRFELLRGRERPNRSSSRSTRFACACASGVSIQMQRTLAPCRPAASTTSRRAARVRYVLSSTTRVAPDASVVVELVGERSERAAALVAVEPDVAARDVLRRDPALARAGNAHHQDDVRCRPGSSRASSGRGDGARTRPPGAPGPRRSARASRHGRPSGRSPGAGRPGSRRRRARDSRSQASATSAGCASQPVRDRDELRVGAPSRPRGAGRRAASGRSARSRPRRQRSTTPPRIARSSSRLSDDLDRGDRCELERLVELQAVDVRRPRRGGRAPRRRAAPGLGPTSATASADRARGVR